MLFSATLVIFFCPHKDTLFSKGAQQGTLLHKGLTAYLHRFEDLRQFHTDPVRRTCKKDSFSVASINISQAVSYIFHVSRESMVLFSDLEKAFLSASSPGSTRRCRAAEKCPQATAISANTTCNTIKTGLGTYWIVTQMDTNTLCSPKYHLFNLNTHTQSLN